MVELHFIINILWAINHFLFSHLFYNLSQEIVIWLKTININGMIILTNYYGFSLVCWTVAFNILHIFIRSCIGSCPVSILEVIIQSDMMEVPK